MTQTFTCADDRQLIGLITAAAKRLVIVAPAFSKGVAEAIALRMDDLPSLSLTVILDPDPEVYRMGYGEVESLEILRKGAAEASFRLREQSGVRIGLIISDEKTLIYSPVSANIEAGSTSLEKPNAIVLDNVADELAIKSGATSDLPKEVAEIGASTLSSEHVAAVQENLKIMPPQPVDLTRKLNVFITRVQYVELKAKGYHLSRRREELPSEFFGMDSSDLKERVRGQISTPIDGIGKLKVKIQMVGKQPEELYVDERFLQKERQIIEKTLTRVMPKRGRIILRQDRASFDFQIKRFELIISTYQKELAKKLEGARADFEKSFVDEFLDRWMQSPPARYSRRLEPASEEQLREGIEGAANKLFDQIVRLEEPNISVIYKDIAIEDLKDDAFMSTLREEMSKGGLKKLELDKLFEQGEAVAVQGDFKLNEISK